MRIEVLTVEIENKAKYKVAKIRYRMGTKEYFKNIFSFGDQKPAYDVLTTNKVGHFEITQDESTQYKNWIKAEPVAAPTGASTTSEVKVAPKSTYETPEERANRQVMIARQSSLDRAVQLLTLQGNKKATELDVINLAESFTKYVTEGYEKYVTESDPPFDVGTAMQKLVELENDVPV